MMVAQATSGAVVRILGVEAGAVVRIPEAEAEAVVGAVVEVVGIGIAESLVVVGVVAGSS